MISDWPQLFGPNGNSTSSERGLRWDWDDNGPPILWRQAIGQGYSAPVIQGEELILHQRVEDQEIVSCLDAETGAPLWSYGTPTSYECKYPYSNGPYSTPTISGETVFAITAQGRLLALSLTDGKTHWERDLLQDFQAEQGAYGVGVSPSIWRDRLILNVGGHEGHGIVALSTRDGSTLWSAMDDDRCYATTVFAEQHGMWHAFVLTEQSAVALDPESGAVRWQRKFGVPRDPLRATAVTPLVVGNYLVLSSGPGPGTNLLQILPDGDFAEIWSRRRVIDGQYTNLLHVDGCFYGGDARSSTPFRCVDFQTGELLWEYDSDLCRAYSLYADGHIVVLGEHGHLACFRPNRTKPDLRWMTSEPVLKTPCFSAPALSRGRLYLRNESELICLDLRAS
ncbi:MAG: hypothetical protein B7Z55_09525 [Planctomycetales bacterium 12-60-4]|nr:MAG: hypothetical protein B7Z55_09525 [Planctomycetales bacterium 12-60-4]